jgi:hypothetical protein
MERSRYLQLRREYEPDNLTLLMWRCLLLSPVCIVTIRLPELAAVGGVARTSTR